MKIDFINLNNQYKKYKSEIDAEIQETLNDSSYIMGPKVEKLERNLSSYINSKNAITCSSGTDALIVALMVVGIKPDDEVITTPFTFIATAEAIAFLGARPVFVDIDEKTYNIDAKKIENSITKKTKVILPVSIFGQVSDMDSISKIAKKYNLKVIEDAAQSFGSTYKSSSSCNLSDIACTSFFPAKPLGCYGDGGAIFTNNNELALQMKIILNHGQTKQYTHSRVGINGRLDAIQAGILNVKLHHYDEEIKNRNKIADKYSTNLQNVIIPHIEKHNSSVWAQYCIRVKNRKKVLKKCFDMGVPTGVYYPIPLHLQKVFQYLKYKKGDFPIAEAISNDIMALPMSAFLKQNEQDYVIEIINKSDK
jgi:UDP-2-acetamido-2-deoxy-ribo-hexuluronate aminotransferase